MGMTNLNGFAITDLHPQPARMSSTPSSNYATILSIYGAGHLLVDASCAAVVFRTSWIYALHPSDFVGMVVLYHALAFGLQPLFGLAVDAAKMPRFAAVLGCVVSSVALLFASVPMLAVVVAGLGNALFHVGGGVISLRLTPHRATTPGLFVAPGSLGLLVGMILGSFGLAANATLILMSLTVSVLTARTQIADYVITPGSKTKGLAKGAEMVVGFILLAIAIRGLLGFVVTFPWHTRPIELLLLTIAVVVGKALGGAIADRWGWLRVSIGATVAAIPFLSCVSLYPMAAIPGLFLLNLTMAVTLTVVADALPGYPAFSFGLTSVALFLGALPSLLGFYVGESVVVFLVMLLSSLVLYRGLRVSTRTDSCPTTA